MATTIKLRRRATADNTGVTLQAGEPFYNTATQKLYIGDKENDSIEVNNKKAINQVTRMDIYNDPNGPARNDIVSFYIGQNRENRYDKLITEVDDLANFENLSEEGSPTIKFRWGINSDHEFKHTIDTTQLEGAIENAANACKVTESIVVRETSYKIDDIFADSTTDGIPNIKYAQQATNATSTNSGTDLDVLAQQVSDIRTGTFSVPKASTTAEIPDIENLDTTVNNVVKFQIGSKTFEKQISVTVPGSVEGADKLTTARAIDGVKFDGTTYIHHLFECNSQANNPNKEVTALIDSGSSDTTSVTFDLEVGSRLFVLFNNGNTATTTNTSSLTLNVAYTGQKPIAYRGQKLTSAPFVEKSIYEFIFTGTYYDLITPIDYYSTEDTYSKTEIDNKIPSLNGYATETYVTNAIAAAELNDKEVDLSGYATKDELLAVETKIPSLEGLATTEYVDQACANTSLQWQTF